MNISPQYTGDAALGGVEPAGSLSREVRLLQEVMANQQAGNARAEAARKQALDDLGAALDARAADITLSFKDRIQALIDIQQLTNDTLVEVFKQLVDLGSRLATAEGDLMKTRGELDNLRQKLPVDANTGRPTGRNYQTVTVV